MKIGTEKGMAEAKREIARKMLAKGFTTDAISEISGLPEEEVRALAD
jgi:predicted transposase/invertase (TIGR01784 family)